MGKGCHCTKDFTLANTADRDILYQNLCDSGGHIEHVIGPISLANDDIAWLIDLKTRRSRGVFQRLGSRKPQHQARIGNKQTRPQFGGSGLIKHPLHKLQSGVTVQAGADLTAVEDRNLMVRSARDIRQQQVTFFQCVDGFTLVAGRDGAARHQIELAVIETAKIALLGDIHLKGHARHAHGIQQTADQLPVLLIQDSKILREFSIRQHPQTPV